MGATQDHGINTKVEKPHPNLAPSKIGNVGRYVLPQGIFDLLEQTPPGKGGEIQLTDALHMLARKNKMLGFAFEGRLYDTGNALGLLCASMFKAAQQNLKRAYSK